MGMMRFACGRPSASGELLVVHVKSLAVVRPLVGALAYRALTTCLRALLSQLRGPSVGFLTRSQSARL